MVMEENYSQENVLKIINGLIDGSVDRIQASLWADKIEDPANEEKLRQIEQEDPALYRLISDIGLAGTPDEKHEFLYGKEDFQNWLNEFLQATEKEERK